MAWKKNGSSWNWLGADGKAVKSQWVQDKGKWYYIDKSGKMATGWQQVGGKWYYLNSDGSMRKTWLHDKGKWYAFDDSGAMLTGAQMIDGKAYDFGADGAMVYEDKPFQEDSKLKNQYLAAQKDYDNMAANPEAHGYNAYITDVNQLFDQVMNQEQFSYDPQKDALFQMYKKQYQQQGTRAMNNAMGIGAAMSGGYTSSNAMTNAQATYQQYMDGLNDKAAQTYQNALDMYKYNQQQLTNRYNAAVSMNNAGNDAYYAQLGVKGNVADRLYNLYQDDRNFRYQQGQDARSNVLSRINMAQGQANTDRSYNLKKKLYTG